MPTLLEIKYKQKAPIIQTFTNTVNSSTFSLASINFFCALPRACSLCNANPWRCLDAAVSISAIADSVSLIFDTRRESLRSCRRPIVIEQKYFLNRFGKDSYTCQIKKGFHDSLYICIYFDLGKIDGGFCGAHILTYLLSKLVYAFKKLQVIKDIVAISEHKISYTKWKYLISFISLGGPKKFISTCGSLTIVFIYKKLSRHKICSFNIALPLMLTKFLVFHVEIKSILCSYLKHLSTS